MLRNEFIRYQDNLYIVKKIVREDIHPEMNIEAIKEFTGSDIALKREGLVYFGELVPEAEIVPEAEDECIRKVD